MLVGLIPWVRENTVGQAISSLSDCDIVCLRRGTKGEIEARNKLLESVPNGAVVRFCDDDDIASNTRTLFDSLGDNCVVAASYTINNKQIVLVPSCNPLFAATNYVGPWNWVARIECLHKIRDRYGSYFDEKWPCNTGARFWLRMIDVGLSFRFMPNIVCYRWNRGLPGSKSSVHKNDKELYDELIRRGAPRRLVADRMRFDAAIGGGT